MQCRMWAVFGLMVSVATGSAAQAPQPSGPAFTQLVADSGHTCGLLADSKRVTCWGATMGRGQDAVSDVEFRSVATGAYFGCGARVADGGLVCWGSSQPLVGAGDFSHVAVSASSYGPGSACAIRTADGAVECFSYAGKITGVPSETGFAELAVSDTVACAVRRDDETMRCWDLIDPSVNEPKIHAPPGGFRALAAAVNFFCAIRTDSNEVVCWGVYPPPDPPVGVAFADFAITSYGAGCGIRLSDQRLQCWGTRVLTVGAPFDLPLKAIAISGSLSSQLPSGVLAHACVLTADSQAHCWGDDRYWQVSGAPNTTPYRAVVSELADPSGLPRVCALRAQDGHAMCAGTGAPLPSDVAFTQITPWCGIRADTGRLHCVGGTHEVQPPDIAFMHIAQRDGVVCGLRAADGRVTCFGSDAERIVTGAPTDTLFSQLSVGQNLACGLRVADGQAQCWGTGATYDVPQVSLRQIVTPRQQSDSICGLRADNGRIMCWGNVESYAPTAVAFTRLSEDAGCGIRADNGHAECWGGYSYLDLPSRLAFSSLTSHYAGACGIDANDGRLTCWGLATWNMH